MKKFLIVFAVLCITQFAFGTNGYAKKAPDSKEKLITRLEQAIKTKNQNDFLALYNWDGVSKKRKRFFKNHIAKEVMRGRLKSVATKPKPEDYASERIIEGVRYTSNIEDLGLVEILYYSNEFTSLTLPYGKKGKSFYLSSTTEEKVK